MEINQHDVEIRLKEMQEYPFKSECQLTRA